MLPSSGFWLLLSGYGAPFFRILAAAFRIWCSLLQDSGCCFQDMVLPSSEFWLLLSGYGAPFFRILAAAFRIWCSLLQNSCCSFEGGFLLCNLFLEHILFLSVVILPSRLSYGFPCGLGGLGRGEAGRRLGGGGLFFVGA